MQDYYCVGGITVFCGTTGFGVGATIGAAFEASDGFGISAGSNCEGLLMIFNFIGAGVAGIGGVTGMGIGLFRGGRDADAATTTGVVGIIGFDRNGAGAGTGVVGNGVVIGIVAGITTGATGTTGGTTGVGAGGTTGVVGGAGGVGGVDASGKRDISMMNVFERKPFVTVADRPLAIV